MSRGKRSVATTYNHMVSDPEFVAITRELQRQANIDQSVMEAAFELLRDSKLSNKNIAMVIEFQVGLRASSKLRDVVSWRLFGLTTNAALSHSIPSQLYLTQFLQIKKKLHGVYKFQRVERLADLVRDLAKYATNQDMAYQATGREYNEAYIARARRDLRKLGLKAGCLEYVSDVGVAALGRKLILSSIS